MFYFWYKNKRVGNEVLVYKFHRLCGHHYLCQKQKAVGLSIQRNNSIWGKKGGGVTNGYTNIIQHTSICDGRPSSFLLYKQSLLQLYIKNNWITEYTAHIRTILLFHVG